MGKEVKKDSAKVSDGLHEEIKKHSKKDRRKRFLVNGLIVCFLIFLAILAKIYVFKGDIKINDQIKKSPNEKIENRPDVESEKKETPQPPAATNPNPQPAPAPAPTPEPQYTNYTVKEGDTYSSIANSNGMTSKKLMDYNGVSDPSSLQPGQVIKIPK